MALVRSLFHGARRSMVELALAICRAVSHRFSSGATQSPFMAGDRRAGCLRFVSRCRESFYPRMMSRHNLLCVERESSNQSMKPTAPWRYNFNVFATTPCRGLSLSR